MGLLRRSLPEPVRDAVTLAKGERVLVAASAREGWVVATTEALWLPDRTGMAQLGWESIDNAAWDDDTGTLQIVQTARLGGRPRRWHLSLDGERELLLVIKERVRATVVTSRRVPVVGEQGITVVARRRPGQDEVTWAVSVDPGVDVADPRVRQIADDTVREMRSDLGR